MRDDSSKCCKQILMKFFLRCWAWSEKEVTSFWWNSGFWIIQVFFTSMTVLFNLFDTVGHLVNFPPAGGLQSRGTMASVWSASL